MENRLVALLDLVSGIFEERMEECDPDLVDLAESIKEVGLLQPIVVVERAEGLVIVAGHRRYAACRMAGVVEVPVRIMTGKESEIRGAVWAENHHRRDPSPIERAASIRQVLEDKGATEEEVAKSFRKGVDWVRRQVKMCEWPVDVLEAVHGRRLSVGAASHLAKVTDEEYRKYILMQAVENGVTERTTASWLQAWRMQAPQEEAVLAEPLEGSPGQGAEPPRAPCAVCCDFLTPASMRYVGLCADCLDIIQAARERMRQGQV